MEKIILTTPNLKQIIITDPHHFFLPVIPVRVETATCPLWRWNADLFTMTAPSSIMQFDPITIGPAIAKMVAFG